MSFISNKQRSTIRLPLSRNFATSTRHASENAKDRYRGKAKDRLYEGINALEMSEAEIGGTSCVMDMAEARSEGALYGGGSSAEKAGVRTLIVQALSGVGSSCVDRASYA